MGLWDSVKKGASDFSQLSTLQNKVKNNEVLTVDEIEEFERLTKGSIEESIRKNPTKYFKKSNKYGQVEIDDEKRLFKIGLTAYHFDDLNSYELLENGSAITSGGLGVGRAIVGGVLLGGVGAVLGGVTKKKKQTNFVESLKILVTFKNKKPVSTTIDFIKKKQKKDKKYESILLTAQETLAGFDYIINVLENDKHGEIVGNISGSNNLSVADELRKYKELADDGIITIEEFESKKKELLE
ncbi:SHOCT domain-containing protein [Vagococcus xieshaowenii]|uniref:SHOCT domain-containing protein n=1 Tax=Vagococcus xieshaowenii TaxID=2562451 RepID=A0AAJ5JLC7_9ENTE|nr:SHOCT domain-containing protein [Vagococcus xieshaowenii]QCA28223.1 SHOCT domain-containing protein [Vagococcus xieshaowenii]TFZ41878.1 SHOCT domain-containing protein [Vagococcus xieshaowenii]